MNGVRVSAWAVAATATVCVLLSSCTGGTTTGAGAGIVPVSPMQVAGGVPHIFHITPFFKSKRPISHSSGQDVYALFGWSGVKLGKLHANLTTFGAPATNGYAGPMAQVAVVESSTQKQHAYVDSQNALRELTDAATGIVMLTKTISPDETQTEVCQGGKQIGLITIKNGKAAAKPASGRCSKELDVVAPAARPASRPDDSDAYPSVQNVDYDICSLSDGAIPLAATLFTAAAKFDTQLAPLGPAYKAFATFLHANCNSGVAPSAPKPAPCVGAGRGSACNYQSPPVPIVANVQACPASGSSSTIDVTFYAPGQHCTVSISYAAGSSGTFSVSNPNAFAVTVTPASGTLDGSGAQSLQVQAGQQGGEDTVAVTLSIGSSPSVVSVAVTNEWASGGATATPAPGITSYPLATNSEPFAITVGPDNALWFTEVYTGKVGRITTSGALTEYPLSSPTADPSYITVGSDNALWFTENASSLIGRLTTTGSLTEYPLPISAAPFGITSGPDGNIWFTDDVNNTIDAMTTSGTILYEYAIPTNPAYPEQIITGPDGALWFTEDQGHKVARVTTTGAFSEYPVSTPAGSTAAPLPAGITVGPDENLWVTDVIDPEILKVTPSGSITSYSTAPNGLAQGITTGPDGAVWFSVVAGSTPVGRITTAGAITYISSTGVCESGLVTGPDGNLWGTDSCASSIDKIAPVATVSAKGGKALRRPRSVPMRSAR